MLSLYDYWRSTAAYRIRIALNLKKIPYQIIPVNLVKNGGEHLQKKYKTINPQGLIPALQLETGQVLTQSMAIMEYLEEEYPDIPILPEARVDRGQCRAVTQVIVSDIHPLNNLRVLKYLKQDWSQQKVDEWYHHWVHTGFVAIEQSLDNRCYSFMSADYPCISDICLMAQLYNARRFNISLKTYPLILDIEKKCSSIEAFVNAHPDQQPGVK